MSGRGRGKSRGGRGGGRFNNRRNNKGSQGKRSERKKKTLTDYNYYLGNSKQASDYEITTAKVLTTLMKMVATKMKKKKKQCLSPSHKLKANATVVANPDTRVPNVDTKTNRNQNGGLTRHNSTFNRSRPLPRLQINPVILRLPASPPPRLMTMPVPPNNPVHGWVSI